MSSVVFILGAGASQQCGAPLMANFLDVAFDLLCSNKADSKKDAFEKVFKAIGLLQSVHSKSQFDLTNIESVFTALELGKIIQTVPGLTVSEIPETISALKELIVKTLEVTMRFPVTGQRIDVPAPYNHFAELIKHIREKTIRPHTVSVITFNYDIASDMALYRNGMGPHYAIDAPPGHPNFVPLLKLHGSLNWATSSVDKSILPLHLENYFRHYQINGFPKENIPDIPIPIGSHLRECFTRYLQTDVEHDPVIVPPTWNKSDYHQALSTVWATAAKHLSEAEYIFIIGYSLPTTDSFFRHLYALGSVGQTPLREFSVYNPENFGGGVDSRFREILGPGAAARYRYYPSDFHRAISQISQLFPAKPR